jgi:tetratricopeptide (TPR) repeat protein
VELLAHLASAGQWQRVETLARELLGRDPSSPPAHTFLAWSLIVQDRAPQSWPSIEFLLSATPDEAQPHLLAAQFYARAEKWAQVEAHANCVLEIDPHDAQACLMKGISLGSRLRLNEAQQWIDRAREIDPDSEAIAVYQTRLRGAVDQSASVAWQQVRRLEELLAVNPESAATWNALGDVYLQLEQPAKAEECYRECLRLGPGDRDYQLDLFRAVAARSVLYRTVALPLSACRLLATYVGHLHFRPSLLLWVVLGFKAFLMFLAWLAVTAPLFVPPAKLFEWLLLAEVQPLAGASDRRMRLRGLITRVPYSARIVAFLLVAVCFWTVVFACMSVSWSAGLMFLGSVALLHFGLVELYVGLRKLSSWLGQGGRRNYVRLFIWLDLACSVALGWFTNSVLVGVGLILGSWLLWATVSTCRMIWLGWANRSRR